MWKSFISVYWFTLLTAGIIGGFIKWSLFLLTRERRYFASADTVELITGTANAEGIVLESESGETGIAWTSIVAAMEKPKHFLLYDDYNYFGTSTYYKIPKRAFVGASTLDRFRDLIRNSVPEAQLQV